MPPRISFVAQQVAKQIDVDLMSIQGGFSIDQLMELAGLSVAEAVYKEMSVDRMPHALVVCGPGNNGGDGLVVARHLHHFGYKPVIYYPKPTDKPLFHNLQQQLRGLEIRLIETTHTETNKTLEQYLHDTCDFIVDAIFGFSFSGAVRAPFDSVIKMINKAGKPIVSIDIPSGWDVEKGNIPEQLCIDNPTVLVSLSAPKMCAQYFKGRHYVGGRFIPQSLLKKYDITIPSYKGSEQCVLIE